MLRMINLTRNIQYKIWLKMHPINQFDNLQARLIRESKLHIREIIFHPTSQKDAPHINLQSQLF